MKSLEDYVKESARQRVFPVTGDVVECNINEELAIDLGVVEHTDDGVVVEMDALAQYILEHCGCSFEEEVNEAFTTAVALEPGLGDEYKTAVNIINKYRSQGVTAEPEKMDNHYEIVVDGPPKAMRELEREIKSAGVTMRATESMDHSDLDEAEYQGRDVELNKPMRGDVKKFKVFVRDPKTGNVKKVNFGSKEMEIKRDDPARRRSFRARHKCADKTLKKDGTTASYWSCRMWTSKPVSKILKGK